MNTGEACTRNTCHTPIEQRFFLVLLYQKRQIYTREDQGIACFVVFDLWLTLFHSKISSTIVSLFASNYVMHWPEYFGQDKLHYAPCFDSRTVCYPNDNVLRDYLSWRQADCK